MTNANKTLGNETFADLLAESFAENSKIEGSVVKGKVVSIENEVALVDVGLKSEGRISLKEFSPPGVKTEIKIDNDKFSLNNYEMQILKKISEWPRCVELSSLKLEPHRIPFYLYDLVTLFHSYWNLGKENKEFRFVLNNNSLNNSRLLLLQALFIVIRNGMSILGVSTPKSM